MRQQLSNDRSSVPAENDERMRKLASLVVGTPIVGRKDYGMVNMERLCAQTQDNGVLVRS